MLPIISSLKFDNCKDPFLVFRPNTLINSVKSFINGFSGKVIYAVKSNPSRYILETVFNQGINSFDVASINEVKIVRNLFPRSNIFFMNPIKPKYSISEAYFKYNVRNFAIDTEQELEKILLQTKNAIDLKLHIRLAIPNDFAKINLSGKFGINPENAIKLINKASKYALKIGISFHPGSQCMHTDAYKIGIEISGEVIKKCKKKIDYLNVGGGFPSVYEGMKPPPLESYFKVINHEFSIINKSNMTLIAEPGRALVAECMSLIVRVDLRKDNKLYINDGIYGHLHAAGKPGFSFPVRMISKNNTQNNKVPFSFYGPTCDSNDYMAGPFYLPMNINEGDFIEIGHLGAYSNTMKTNFNGFSYSDRVVIIRDESILDIFKSRVN
jgi:ornithine decarboxylase